MECLFCAITSKTIPSKLIYEDDWTTSVLDIHPCSSGHTLVLPKQHGASILDFTEESLGKVWEGVKNTTFLLKTKLTPDGFTIGINHGKAGGQVVEHLHIHIIPRFENDGGGSLHSVVHGNDIKSVEEIYTILKE